MLASFHLSATHGHEVDRAIAQSLEAQRRASMDMARTLDAIASQLGDAFVEDRLLALTAGVQPARRVLSAGDQKS